MKVAAAQTPVSADIASNAAAIRNALEDAAAQDVRLVVFCEGALSGYAKAQIAHPDDWRHFDWATQETELRSIAALCARLNVGAVVGAAHRLSLTERPHNSLYVISPAGDLLTRYDKRFLSHSEVEDWYTPGTEPTLFDLNGLTFGCAICIESQFPEVFIDYAQRGADAVLFASYGIPQHFQVALRAHAGLNCMWIVGATPSQKAHKGPAGVIGPDGICTALGPAANVPALAVALLDRDDPAFDGPLNKARPWRSAARAGEIYRRRMVDDPRSRKRDEY